MSAEEKTELDRWRERLNATGLPVFARTVREVSYVANSKASSAVDLSEVIGRDASMSAKIIQIANSPVFNFQNRAINSIDEAVVLVGFDAIRELVISVSVLEELQKGPQDERCALLMARAFHAAAHSKFISQAQSQQSSEDVFAGALLKDVGPMAFWARGGEKAEQLRAQLHPALTDEAVEQLQRDCLGFTLKELSLALATDWSLGDMVTQVLKERMETPGVDSVLQGHALALQIENLGLDAPEVTRTLRDLANQLGKPSAEVVASIEDNFAAANDLVEHLGISVDSVPDSMVAQPSTATEAPASPEQIMQALQNLADAMERGESRDLLMQRVVDTLYEQLNYVGSAFALFTPNRERLVVKFRSGAPIFAETVLEPDELAMDVHAPDAGKVTAAACAEGTQHSSCVRINSKPVGVLFGTLSLDPAQADGHVAGFRQMAQQLTVILTASL